jgi:hypothetical protein
VKVLSGNKGAGVYLNPNVTDISSLLSAESAKTKALGAKKRSTAAKSEDTKEERKTGMDQGKKRKANDSNGFETHQMHSNANYCQTMPWAILPMHQMHYNEMYYQSMPWAMHTNPQVAQEQEIKEREIKRAFNYWCSSKEGFRKTFG